MKEYYYSHDGNALGPFPLGVLKTKSIKPDTLIWYEGLSEWTPAKNIEELSGILDNTYTPPPSGTETNQQDKNTYGKRNAYQPPKKTSSGLVVFLIVLGIVVSAAAAIIIVNVIDNDSSYTTTYVEPDPTPIDGVWNFYYNYEDYGLNLSGGLADGRYYIRSVSFDGRNLSFSYSYKSATVSGTVNSNGSFTGRYTTSSSSGPVYLRFDTEGEADGEWECDDCFLPISGEMWIDYDY